MVHAYLADFLSSGVSINGYFRLGLFGIFEARHRKEGTQPAALNARLNALHVSCLLRRVPAQAKLSLPHFC